MPKSVSHHARFRSILVSGGSRIRPQEDSLDNAIDMVVGTPGSFLQHIEEGNIVYGDIAYLVWGSWHYAASCDFMENKWQ